MAAITITADHNETPASLGQADVPPRYTLPSSLDGTPIHLGAGTADKLDLRVTFVDGKVVEHKNVAIRAGLRASHDGRLEPVK